MITQLERLLADNEILYKKLQSQKKILDAILLLSEKHPILFKEISQLLVKTQG